MTNKNKNPETGPPRPRDARATTVRTRGTWRLRSYLVVLVVAVCAPLFAFQIYEIAGQSRERHAQAATVSYHIARAIAGEVAQFVSATDRGLAFLATRPKVRALDPADCDPMLKILQVARERIANVLTVDLDGRLVCSAAGVDPARPQQVAPEYWLARLRETGQPVIGSPARGFITGLWVVTMAYPLRDDAGKMVGAAAMAMDLARFQFGQEGLQVPEGTTITILTGEGVVIARSAEGETWLGKNVAESETVRAVLAKRSGTLRSEGFDGIERDYGFAPVAGTEWVVLAGFPAAAAMAEVRKTMLAVAYAAALTFLIAVFLAWLVARRISLPVKEVAAVAGRVAAGDDSVRAPVAGPTEIAEVAMQFNRMLYAQRSQRQALHQTEERYRELIGGIKSGVAVYTAWQDGEDFVFTDLNPAGERLEKTTKQEVVGRRATEVFPGVVEFGLLDVFRRVWKTGQPEHHPVSFYRDNRITGWRENYVHRLASGEVVAVYDDVTEPKQAEAALRESEDRYRDLIENSQDLICTHDLEGRLLSVNAAAVRLTGYSREALLSMNIADLLTRGAQDSFAAYLAEIRTKGAARGLMRIRTADGKTRWWEYDNTLRIEGVGAPAVRGMAQDITERKRLEATLRESEERFRGAFENAPVGMCLVAADGRFLQVNGALCRMLGYSESELLAKTFLDATHPDDVIPSDQSVRRLLAGKATAFELEKRYLHAAGHIVWGRVRSFLVRKPDGSPLFFITHVQDITERKRTEQELKDLSNRLQHILASTPAVHYACRVDGERFVPTFASANLNAILGYDPAECLDNGEWWWSGIHPEERDSVAATIRAAFMTADRSHFAHEYRFRRRNGTYRWVHDEMRIIRDQGGQPQEIIGSWLDITEGKQSENELQTSRKQLRVLAARLSTAKEEETTSLAREIHDELGQALTGLKMDLSWLASRLGQDRRALKKKAESMTELVDTTIDRVRNIATRLRPKMLDDLGLVAAIEWQAQEFRKRAGVKCEVVSSVDIAKMGQHVSSAVFRITQEALTNIARHAVATRADISLYEESGWLILEVRDNGKGIRVEEITADKSIGLLGMRERALAVGGELTISGFPGRGTVATLRIPLRAR